MQPIDWFFSGLISGMVVCFLVFVLPLDRGWRRDAVKHGFACYDAISGKWKWKDESANPVAS